jgi:hypothetical protein
VVEAVGVARLVEGVGSRSWSAFSALSAADCLAHEGRGRSGYVAMTAAIARKQGPTEGIRTAVAPLSENADRDAR